MQSANILRPEFRQIVSGRAGAEGPVFDATGKKCYMVAPEVEVDGKSAGQVLEIDAENKKAELLCSPCAAEFGGIPAGCQMDKAGHLWVADMRLGLLKICTENGTYQQICKIDCDSHPMQGCNDCVFDSYGNLWITAPAGQIAPASYKRSMQEAFGSLYCYSSAGVMKKIDTGYKFPNGIAVQYDAKGLVPVNLIVAETPTKTLWSIPFMFDEDGDMKVNILEKKIFGRCPGEHEGGPDGMDFDNEGNLLVANWGSGYIEVFDKSGGHPFTRIELPFKRVSNLHFKPGTKEVCVTEHDSHGLWHFEWINGGAQQYCEM